MIRTRNMDSPTTVDEEPNQRTIFANLFYFEGLMAQPRSFHISVAI